MIVGNDAWQDGGGIFAVFNCDPLIENNTILGNTASQDNGGIGFGVNCNPVIRGNTISRNEASAKNGGGIGYAFNSHPIIEGNIITENKTNINGGGITVGTGASGVIEGNTITGNSALKGGGVGIGDNSDPIIINSIIRDNDAELGNEIYLGYEYTPPTLTISYSDVEGGLDSVYAAYGCDVMWLDGMIDTDPMFLLPDIPDYRLLWDSPCIDTGHPDSLDADGTRADIGAHFFDQDDHLTLYVTPDSSWTSPGEQLGVTYTVINRWPQSESFWMLSQVLLPGGLFLDVLGLDQYTLPAGTTVQVHLQHTIPLATHAGTYEYWTRIGLPPSTLYDEDRFDFVVFK
jgi:parallel beta-helix repeat protein